jgi:hypothetical protein
MVPGSGTKEQAASNHPPCYNIAVMGSAPRYWFRAKRYGWGWGLPLTWEGWLSLAAFVAMLALSAVVFSPASQPVAYAVSIVLLCAALVAVCYFKGEPARWRWRGR